MDDWPALPFEEWRATRDTLHMYTQGLGWDSELIHGQRP